MTIYAFDEVGEFSYDAEGPLWLDGDRTYCEDNFYDCNDFCSQEDAQKMFDECYQGEKDIHFLDSNNDGVACESLK